MAKKIIIEISDLDLKKAKKQYDKLKLKKPDMDLSFDEYLQEAINNAFKTHLDINEMNENVGKVFEKLGESMGITDNFKFGDSLKDFDSMVQDIFKNNMKKDENKDKKNESDSSKKIKN